MPDGGTRRMLQDRPSAIQSTGLAGMAVARTTGLDARFDSTGNEVFRDPISRKAEKWTAIKQCRASAAREVRWAKLIPTEFRSRFTVGRHEVRYRFTHVRMPISTDGLSDSRL